MYACMHGYTYGWISGWVETVEFSVNKQVPVVVVSIAIPCP